MSGFYYPALDENTLQALLVIQELVSQHPDYFQKSTYSLEVENTLTKLFKPRVVTQDGVEAPNVPPLGDEPPEEMFEGLREEIKSAYLHLKKAKNDDHGDKIAYAKAAVSLLEKLVKMEQAVINIEMVGSFQREVVAFMEDVCTPKQIQDFMQRVKDYLSPDAHKVVEAAVAADTE